MAKKKAAKKATKKKKKASAKKSVETITHSEDKRRNIPTAELESVVSAEDKTAKQIKYPRNTDLDPQLVWRGKDEQDWSDLVVNAPPLYIQEKVHPKVLVDDLLKQTQAKEQQGQKQQLDLFADFNGLPEDARSAEFYQHDANWTNRMILGDSLQVMASLAEREGLRGQVQCIYIDPPYGINFNSNFQWSTKDRKGSENDSTDKMSREPEQVKAFRDTWRDGIHTYLSYLRDRLTIARDLLSTSGSVFVQIGDENVHRVRGLMDEVFGDSNFVVSIIFKKKGNQKGNNIESINDTILWYARTKEALKSRILFKRSFETDALERDYTRVHHDLQDFTLRQFSDFMNVQDTLRAADVLERYPESQLFMSDNLTVGGFRTNQSQLYVFRKKERDPGLKINRCWMHTSQPIGDEKYCGLDRLHFANRILETGGGSIRRRLYLSDSGLAKVTNLWTDTAGAKNPRYVVETNVEVIKRCILMASDPGDLVLDPTCGSGATAYAAEQWGRRWITIDTSRVALALARTRIMGARYPFYFLSDSPEGLEKESEVYRTEIRGRETNRNVRLGFVYERVARITSSVVANNTELDEIWEQFEEKLEPLRNDLNKALKQEWEEWEIPRHADDSWSDAAKKLHANWWELRIAQQKEMDASIAARADFEYLYDKPYEDKSKVRVAGPFTVESLSPHRVLGIDEDDELIDSDRQRDPDSSSSGTDATDFAQVMLDNLKTSGVQQSAKEDRINFTSISGWPGEYVCAQGTYTEGDADDAPEKKAGIFIGPEFGTVARADLVAAARECGDANFDVLIACAFNFDAHSSEFNKLGPIPVLKARMNADLHMAEDLKNTGKGNLFVIFGEPDIDIRDAKGEGTLGQIEVQIHGVDVFKPQTGEVESDNTDGIACWFIDTDYNEESFFVRHAYFLGASDPYKSLKTTLKTEINEEAWSSLNSDTSRPFNKPKSGRIAVKVINHLGDEVMKVFKVE